MDAAQRILLRSLFRKLGEGRFNVRTAWPVVFPRRHGDFAMQDQQHMAVWFDRLVRDGLLMHSPGPRGGRGWQLTPAAVEALAAEAARPFSVSALGSPSSAAPGFPAGALLQPVSARIEALSSSPEAFG